MDPLPVVLGVVGAALVGVIVFRMRGLVGSIRSLSEALYDLIQGRGRRSDHPKPPSLPTDDRFRDVSDERGDERPGRKPGRPDPYA